MASSGGCKWRVRVPHQHRRDGRNLTALHGVRKWRILRVLAAHSGILLSRSRDTAPEDSDAFKATKVVAAEANPYLRDDTVAFGPCLPAELCCMIMSMVNLADRLSMSRVCSSWRTAALSNPLLWTRLDSVNLRTRGATFVRLLSRSNDLPLQISVDMLHLVFDLQKRRVDNWMPLARHIVHALRQHMHRVVDLRIWCRLDTASQLFNGTSVPVLRTLDISFASTAALPHHWLNRWAPELQCLRLTNAVLPMCVHCHSIRAHRGADATLRTAHCASRRSADAVPSCSF